MFNFKIKYPSSSHKNFLESVYNFCEKNQLSLILKGSLANSVATKFSDIDLIVLGDINESQLDELIIYYDTPIMTNFTENPKGILILVYKDNISTDLDIRKSISEKELVDSIVLLKYDDNFIINNEEIIRKDITSKYMPNRPDYYKTMRLLHKGTTKYLSGKVDLGYKFLAEIKEKLITLDITDLEFENNFESDIEIIFNRLYTNFNLNVEIKALFDTLFKEFKR
ncbi:nucleotidyltransferase domain-containing protein [Clostridium cellulovorans]|uniref:DNA polymerase beta domain protein region n=1 Tax=Clostridium cellulovorans (strain ATCC 35296 / DSM 3052 / OCM 3 / 743B) TaxID=573061 RepID=D9STH6_CLOC7|nr:nucleotidyltransferase domain-containing protein [Clostridium cellulovorans]ADL52710.1 DNA polymerase beta domain protein region [Clostridium cellulovorans 743B]